MLDFPNINPIALDLGIIEIRWYALSYICGILLSWFLILKIIKTKNVEVSDKSVSDLISNCMIGIILGGRLGYVIFYNLEYYINNLLEIFKIWNGGMSFHGGFIGVIIAVIYTSKSNKTPIIGNNRLNENISKNKLKNENTYNKINWLLYFANLKFL